jgi:hypothetical protein
LTVLVRYGIALVWVTVVVRTSGPGARGELVAAAGVAVEVDVGVDVACGGEAAPPVVATPSRRSLAAESVCRGASSTQPATVTPPQHNSSRAIAAPPR